MGVHFVNPGLIDLNDDPTVNDTIDASKPEVLVYEPDAAGHYRLVALEYLILQKEWDATQASSPPSLFGHEVQCSATRPIGSACPPTTHFTRGSGSSTRAARSRCGTERALSLSRSRHCRSSTERKRHAEGCDHARLFAVARRREWAGCGRRGRREVTGHGRRRARRTGSSRLAPRVPTPSTARPTTRTSVGAPFMSMGCAPTQTAPPTRSRSRSCCER